MYSCYLVIKSCLTRLQPHGIYMQKICSEQHRTIFLDKRNKRRYENGKIVNMLNSVFLGNKEG